MLEAAGVLRTWRLIDAPVEPADWFDRGIDAEQLPDHRLHYLDYEGPVGGDRGVVAQWDRGEYELLEESETTLIIKIAGRRIRGVARLHADPAGGPDAGGVQFYLTTDS